MRYIVVHDTLHFQPMPLKVRTSVLARGSNATWIIVASDSDFGAAAPPDPLKTWRRRLGCPYFLVRWLLAAAFGLKLFAAA